MRPGRTISREFLDIESFTTFRRLPVALLSHCAYTSDHACTLSILWPKLFVNWSHCGWRIFYMVPSTWIYTDVLKFNQQGRDLALKSTTVNLFKGSPTFPHCDIVVEKNFEDQYTNCVLKHSWVIWKEASQDRKWFWNLRRVCWLKGTKWTDSRQILLSFDV